MNTLPILIALFLKLNFLYGGLSPDYSTDFTSTAAWLERIKPVYYEMGLVSVEDVEMVEAERPGNVPDDVSVWISGVQRFYDLKIYYAAGDTNPFKIRAGVAHDYLQLQVMDHLGAINSFMKKIQYENVSETGTMTALAIMANQGDPEARDTLIYVLWERSIVSTLYQALLSGGVEEAEALLASYNLDEGTYNRFYRVIELWQKEPKTSRTLNTMYYNGVLDKILNAEDGIVTGIGTPTGTMDVSELQKFIARLTRKPPVPRLMGRHANETLDRWAGCSNDD